MAWLVKCDAPEELHKAEETARHEASLNRTVVSNVTGRSGGAETNYTISHVLSDYFSDMKVEHASMLDDSNAFRIFFYPAMNADRFWKDLMIGILQSIEKSASGVSIRPLKQ
jgi:hypothetical protein